MLLQNIALGDLAEISSPCTSEELFMYNSVQGLTWWNLNFCLKHLAQHLLLRVSQLYKPLYVRMKVTFPSRADITDTALFFRDHSRATGIVHVLHYHELSPPSAAVSS